MFSRLQDVDDVRPPTFNRRQAEEWCKYLARKPQPVINRRITVYYQNQVAQRVKNSVRELGETRGHLLSRRPFQSQWYSSQVAICLALWNYDRSLLNALELAKSFLIPLETLNVLWPCQGNIHIVHAYQPPSP